MWTEWTPAPAILVGAAVGLQLFVGGFRRLRRRGRRDHASWSRAVLFLLALLLALVALVSPLDTVADSYLLTAHMLQHLLIGDIVPALLLLALRGPLLFFVLPPSLSRVVLRQRSLRTAMGALARPIPAFALWASVIAAWHVPAAYDFALRHETVHDLEHCSFLAVGLLAWAQLIDPARRQRLDSRGRSLFVVAMFAFSLTLSLVLLAAHPLYGFYINEPVHLYGITASADQRLAGLLMLGEQFGALCLCLTLLNRVAERPLLRERAAPGRRYPITAPAHLAAIGSCRRG